MSKIISFSVDSELEKLLGEASARLGYNNRSKLFRAMVTKYLPLMVNERDDIPVIFMIPGELAENEEELRNWLNAKVEATIKAITS